MPHSHCIARLRITKTCIITKGSFGCSLRMAAGNAVPSSIRHSLRPQLRSPLHQGQPFESMRVPGSKEGCCSWSRTEWTFSVVRRRPRTRLRIRDRMAIQKLRLQNSHRCPTRRFKRPRHPGRRGCAQLLPLQLLPPLRTGSQLLPQRHSRGVMQQWSHGLPNRRYSLRQQRSHRPWTQI